MLLLDPIIFRGDYRLNQEKGGCPTGQAEVTTAGNLPAKYLIHAVGPRWLDGEHNEPQLLCDAYSNALDLLRK
ncbi:TPA: macro domain-containing protein [Escherichia coli]|nr:macro domain-containing protein [Escherichia coli]